MKKLSSRLSALKNASAATIIYNTIVVSIFAAGGLIISGNVVLAVLLVFTVASTTVLYGLSLMNQQVLAGTAASDDIESPHILSEDEANISAGSGTSIYAGTPDEIFEVDTFLPPGSTMSDF